ncbi:MAG TPA: prepilin-type N-terminal cleavage/methylation domain-containing protein [Burkholderiaceae bacterium]|nr:prepilin-type N-terminal cleavage/methylation domain-containing protein [Burkholderiaceae bacterium]
MDRFQKIHGFTLLELMVVIAIIAIVSAGAVLVIPDSSQTDLDRDAQRLTALLDSARAQSRASGLSITWHPTNDGFKFEGLPQIKNTRTDAYEDLRPFPSKWLSTGTGADTATILTLGPEPILSKQEVVLNNAGRNIIISSDGLRPFAIGLNPESASKEPRSN